VIAAVVFGLLALVTASCGNLQDPANGTATQSGVPGAEVINASEDGSLEAIVPPGEMRTVTLAWDPSISEGVLGYKVHLIVVSTAIEQIIDLGPATALAVPLKVGESYGVTVTAYNTSFESQALPYMLFHVLHDGITIP